MAIIIDRRLTDRNKSFNNRKKYLDRIKDQLKDAVKKTIQSTSVKDLLSSKQKNVTIPGKGLSKPDFRFRKDGGILDHVHPGNKHFDKGHRQDRPEDGDGAGGGREGGLGEDGEDPFSFSLSKEEFLNIFFEDLELPDLIKKQLAEIKESTPRRAGFSTDGTPNRLNVLRSMKQAIGRKFALTVPLNKMLEELQFNLNYLLTIDRTEEINSKITELEKEIEILKIKIKAIPFIDDLDLRYNRWENKPQPVTQAVMFAILDVSGSMGEWEKEMAKRYFYLLALFLQCNYEKMDIRWIIHTTEAHEVEEEEFFNSRLSGGTVVSSGLEKTRKIIEAEYPAAQWNIFISQISDGDNHPLDNPKVMNILQDHLLPITQYYTYVEMRQGNAGLMAQVFGAASNLYTAYSVLGGKYKNFKRSIINDVTAIYPVFRKLFEKKQ